MPEVREDPLTGDRVIVAPERAGRPSAFDRSRGATKPPAYDPDCPFCVGNESMTPQELHREPQSSDDWRARVVLNKYPMVEAEAAADEGRRADDSLLHTEAADGHHEVIIESPRHDVEYTDLDAEAVLAVWRSYRARFGAVASDPATRHITIFRNHGAMANASLPHLHSQLVALRFVPPAVDRLLQRNRAYATANSGRALLTDVVSAEVEAGARVVNVDEELVTFVPFAPSHEYETWIAPAGRVARFDSVSDDALARLGDAVRRVLAALADVLDRPDYNMILQTSPLIDGAAEVLPWFVRVIPRLAAGAGLELGTGLAVTTVDPDSAAEALRRAVAGP